MSIYKVHTLTNRTGQVTGWVVTNDREYYREFSSERVARTTADELNEGNTNA